MHQRTGAHSFQYVASESVPPINVNQIVVRLSDSCDNSCWLETRRYGSENIGHLDNEVEFLYVGFVFNLKRFKQK